MVVVILGRVRSSGARIQSKRHQEHTSDLRRTLSGPGNVSVCVCTQLIGIIVILYTHSFIRNPVRCMFITQLRTIRAVGARAIWATHQRKTCAHLTVAEQRVGERMYNGPD